MNKVKLAKWSNLVKSFVLLLFVVSLAGVLFYFFGYLFNPKYAYLALIFGLISSAFYSLLSIFIGPKMILHLTGARPLEEHPRYEEVKEVVEELCAKAKVPVPKLWYMPGEDINAFATGTTPKSAHIVITSGALQRLDKKELAGILGHEIGHIAHYDILYMTLVSVVVGLISFVSNWLSFSFFFSDEEKPLWVYALAFIISILAPISAYLIQLAISRQREYLQDAFSAELNGSPEGLISAFEKIVMYNQGRMFYGEALEPLYFVGPLEELFSTHPPIEKRIQRLRELFNK